ncbi:pyruvate dehydrogenase complex [Pelagibacterium halotolerans B2]|uniref:Pyruvate dehydrogenase complex n=2 Tax=Pelagibacterium TaxID=1082930 RepID=G4RAZ0_PELHB|nr:pyruvate dehydrogenase complex [Pelagibacterium halotolerans B2]
MAQDSAVLLAWLKAEGDAVRADEILFEVETDKTTMEIEAGADGFVAQLLSAPGENVPVGNVIAVISEEKPSAPPPSGPETSVAETPPLEEAPSVEPPAVARAPAPVRPAPSPPTTGDRILASPKARRLAEEESLDLALLATQGVEQPYHVKDIETLRALAAKRTVGTAWNEVEARVDPAALDGLVTLLAAEKPGAVSDARIWAAFAAGSLRQTMTESGVIAVRVEAGRSILGTFSDPDRSRLSVPVPADDQAPMAIVRDLTGTRLTRVRLVRDTVPVFTVTRDGSGYLLGLTTPQDALAEDIAVMVLEDFADRVAGPVRHLL